MRIAPAVDQQKCELCGTAVALMDVQDMVRQFAPQDRNLPHIPTAMWMETVVSGTFDGGGGDGAVVTLSQREHSRSRCRSARRHREDNDIPALDGTPVSETEETP